MFQSTLSFRKLLAASILLLVTLSAQAACVNNVVMVHGNTAYPSSWNNTVNELQNRGYSSNQIFLPSWGSKWDASANDHTWTNLAPVESAIQNALASSCTGMIDVMGHSMGVTLAMKAINDLGYASNVGTFIGIAGAQHGLNSCGYYPWNVWTPTCGADGLSVGSPLINSVENQNYGNKVYSIKSYIDEIVCSGGCYVYGSHTSNIDGQTNSYDFALGHFGLQSDTYSLQADLITQNPW